MKIKKLQRALLINPPSGNYRRDGRCQVKVEDQTVAVNFPPIDLAYDAAVLQERGVEVRIGDYPALGQGWPDFAEDLRSFRPDALIVSATAGTIAGDLEACRLAKESLPETLTLGCGEYLTVDAENILPRSPELDLILLGEPEGALRELAGGVEAAEIDGLAFMEDGRLRKSGERRLVEDLDALPFPARELLANDRYLSPDTRRPLTLIQAQRGCPAKCIFCPAGMLSQYQVRLRSPARVVDEVRECAQRFGLREFLFHGDTFTINKRWLLELCELLIEARLDVRWGCNSRVDTIDDERADALRRAGCWVVAFGVESGSQEMLDKLKKRAKVEDAYQAVEVCRRHGLLTHAFYLIGAPWETRQTLAQTYRLARELDTDFFDFNLAFPLPGTELHQMAVAEGLLERELDTTTGYAQAAMRSYELSAKELTRWRTRALLKLSCRPGYIARTLLRAAREGVLKSYLAAAFKRLKHLLVG